MAELTLPHEMLTVVVPHFIPEKGLHSALHMNTAALLRKALIKYDIVIMEVPYHIGEKL